jgi:hypothetical protein
MNIIFGVLSPVVWYDFAEVWEENDIFIFIFDE